MMKTLSTIVWAFALSVGFTPGTLSAEPTTELAYMPAVEQIKRFKAGTLSPVDVLKAQMERIKLENGTLNTTGDKPEDYMAWNGKVNAITYEHFDEAMVAAQESEKRYKDGTARPLEGLTIGIKDEMSVKGWRVTMGAVGLKDAPLCEEDSPIIDRLRNAGAVMHIQTTVPEFYLNYQTWTKLWGVTRNPWNEHYAVGGSSGGAGAALAGGFTTLAIGSDIGGSIRIPSSLCGLYGFKAPFGRVPTSETPYETFGPMARSFDDMVLMQNAMVGPHPGVHSSIRPKLNYPQNYESIKGVKIAVDYFGAWSERGVDPAVKEALANAAQVLRDQGAQVDEVTLGWKHEEVIKMLFTATYASGSGAQMLEVAQFPDITPYAASVTKFDFKSIDGGAKQAEAYVAQLHGQVQREIFGKGYSALIMPTVRTPYLPADFSASISKVNGDDGGFAGFSFVFTGPWNLLGRYPVVNVPVGLAPNNVPIGMQVVGNTFDDLAAFRVAAGYSKAGLRLYTGKNFPDFTNKP